MASVLLCAYANTGVADDLVPFAARLLERGHRVSVVAGAPAARAFADLDVAFTAVREPELPTASLHRPPFLQRVGEVFEHVQALFVDPMPEQWCVVSRVVADAGVDVIVTDGMFLGAAAVAYLPRAERPAVIDLGTFPLVLPDPSVPPYGFGIPPVDALAKRLQAIALEVAAVRHYLRVSRSFRAMVERLTGVRPAGDIRTACVVADVWAQLTVDRFEYPRAALPDGVRFIGPLRPPSTQVPVWWDPEDRRPVVAVHSDTGAAPDDLIVPTIRAFAQQDVVLVVVGAKRQEVLEQCAEAAEDTVHFETDMPWECLRRDRTVLVSTGSYIHAQHALRRGIPVVAAGTYGHQLETAARIGWSGVGVDLRTRRPDPAAVREAVERIRRDPLIGSAVARIAARIAACDAEAALADLVEQLAPVPSAVPVP